MSTTPLRSQLSPLCKKLKVLEPPHPNVSPSRKRRTPVSDPVEELFEDQSLAAEEGAVEAVLASAGGDPGRAIRLMLTKIGELG
jgi:hypothetical protein